MDKRDERYLPEMPLDVDDLGLRPRLDMLLTEDGNFLSSMERLPTSLHDRLQTPLHDTNSIALNAMAMSRESCMRRVQTCPTDLSSLFQQNNSPAPIQPIQRMRRQMSQTYLPLFGQLEQQQQQQQSADFRFSQPSAMNQNSMPLVDLFATPSTPQSHPLSLSLEHMQNIGHIQAAPVMALPVIGPSSFHNPTREFAGLRRIQTAPVSLASMAASDADQRLAKKAEQARQSRRRKKEQIQQLEAQVTKLSSRLAELQATYNPDQLQASHAYDQTMIKNRMNELLQMDPIPSDELNQLIEEFIRNSRNRQNCADCYLARASRNLAPTVQDRFLHWALNIVSPQASLYDPMADAVKAGISPSQLQQLQAFQLPFQDLSWSLGQIEDRLRKLSKRIRKHLSAQHEHIDRLRSILTVEQVARFCLWVDNNPVCAQMLSRVWGT